MPSVLRKPSTSNTMQSGMSGGTPGGQPGGPARSAVSNPARTLALGMAPEHYLWAIVIIEVLLSAVLRNHFRRQHGG